jgi:hypothetical protein
VAPRKTRPVLFEVIARTQRSRPKGPTPRPIDAAAPAAGEAATPAAPPAPLIPPIRPVPGPGSLPARAWRPVGERRHRAWFGLADNRLELSLGWPELVIVGVVLLLLLALAYQIGRKMPARATTQPADVNDVYADKRPAQRSTGAPPAAPQPGLEKNQRLNLGRQNDTRPPAEPPKPAPPVEKPPEKPSNEVRQAPPPPAPPVEPPKPATPPQFAPGTYCVIVQHFRVRERQEAEAARTFLATKGINTVVKQGAGDLELIVTEPFAGEAQAAGLLQRIRDAGKEYSAAGGGFDFGNPRAQKIKSQP